MKIACFLEGMTEQLFLQNVLTEIIGAHNIKFSLKQRGNIFELTTNNLSNKNIFILLVDCQGDSSVKSSILDNRTTLINKNFDYVLGVIDLLPRNDCFKFKNNLYYGVPQKDLKIDFNISIQEIESYFLIEENHYQKIDPALTKPIVESQLGQPFDTLNSQDILNPVEALSQVYNLAGRSYQKNRNRLLRTIKNLDYANLFFVRRKNNHSLDRLFRLIEQNILKPLGI